MQRNTLLAGLLGAGLSSGLSALAPSSAALAGVVEVQLGEQDFADGDTPIYVSHIREAGAGEAYPFDGTIFGDDETPVLGGFEYVHEFDLAGHGVLSATLTIGLLDHDSPPDDEDGTVALFFDGVAQPTGAFVGISDRMEPSSAEVVTVPVPAELLADGRLTVQVVAERPGMGMLGNSIEADFSRLTILATDPAPGPIDPPPAAAIPLPPALGMASVLIAGIACLRGFLQPRKRRP